jgi:hypothetical protein
MFIELVKHDERLALSETLPRFTERDEFEGSFAWKGAIHDL